MQIPELERLARPWLPGTGEVNIHRRSRGLHHDTFLATRDGRSYSLRVATHVRPPAREQAEFEARVVAAAAGSTLAPRLIYVDPDRGILVLEWLEGSPWSAHSIQQPERIAQFAQLIRRVQGLNVEPPWRTRGPPDWIDEYRGMPHTGAAPEPLHSLADRCLQAWARMSPAATVICHSDLHRLNLLEVTHSHGPATTLLLDWEYAHASDPLWDLAGWSANNDFSRVQAVELLSAYLGSTPAEPEWLRFRLLLWLFDYVCLLWISAYLASNARGSVPQLVARARLLESRLAEPVYGKLVKD